jgi:hypothetical protein
MKSLPSKSHGINPHLLESPRKPGRSNGQWLADHLKPEEKRVTLLVLGGTSPMDFRLRVAQSHLRDDLTPSHWSHVALLGEPMNDRIGDTAVYEISLDPPRGFGYPLPSNGLQKATLARYLDARKWPNIALLHLPAVVQRDAINEALKRFQMQRVVLDSLQLLLTWLAFVWGVGRAPNPLHDGVGIPSASMLEVVIGAAAEFDLTPGLESRSSCPEAIWQSARWWHQYHADSRQGAIEGVFSTSHYLLPEMPGTEI